MKFLVSGGTGFLGSYICKKLLGLGHDVVCYDLSIDQNSIQQVLTAEELDRVGFVQGDICDKEMVTAALKEHKIDRIIHTAGMLNDACSKNVPAAIHVNLSGTVNIFEAARECGIKRVVWASSNSATGNPDFVKEKYLPNDVPHAPITVYGALKSACEFMGDFYNKTYGMETVGMRYVLIYGKARMRGGSNFINELLVKPALGESSVVPNGDGEPNMVYVKDAARATVLAATVDSEKLTRPAYWVEGDIIKIAELKDYVQELLPESEIQLEGGQLAHIKLIETYDTSLEQRDLGYVPEYDARKGARETINMIREEAGLPLV